MLYGLILAIHVLVCFILIAVILLQAGRGGGVADAFGSTAQSILGTRGASFLTKATTVCAISFMLTSIGLAILSAQKGRSLMENARPMPVKTQPKTAPAPAAVPAAAPEQKPETTEQKPSKP